MIRIYLDWGIISNLKKVEVEKFQKLSSILRKYENRIFIPFSDTHFLDLKKGYKIGEKNLMFHEDLKLLSKVAKDHYLLWEDSEKLTNPYKATPEEVFIQMKANWEDTNFLDVGNVFNTLISDMSDLGLKKESEKYKKQLENISVGDKALQNDAKQFFSADKLENSWDLLNQTSKLMSSLLHDRKAFLNLRSTIKKGGLNIDVNHGNWDETVVFEKMNETLKKSELKMSFDEIIDYVEKDFQNTDNIHSKFLNIYIALDVLGYKPDKLKKKSNNMNNIINDANHAFYAAHCDYFIADDINLVKKAKAIYSKKNIPTKILNVDEFIENEKNIFCNQPKSINELLKLQAELYRDENIVEIQEIEGFTYKVFKLPFLLFDYFNYMVVIQRGDNEGFEYYFKRAYNNYSRFIFDIEIETLLNKIIDIFPVNYVENAVKEFEEIIYKEEKSVVLFQEKFLTIYIRKGEYKPELAFYYSDKIRDLSKKDDAN